MCRNVTTLESVEAWLMVKTVRKTTVDRYFIEVFDAAIYRPAMGARNGMNCFRVSLPMTVSVSLVFFMRLAFLK